MNSSKWLSAFALLVMFAMTGYSEQLPNMPAGWHVSAPTTQINPNESPRYLQINVGSLTTVLVAPDLDLEKKGSQISLPAGQSSLSFYILSNAKISALQWNFVEEDSQASFAIPLNVPINIGANQIGTYAHPAMNVWNQITTNFSLDKPFVGTMSLSILVGSATTLGLDTFVLTTGNSHNFDLENVGQPSASVWVSHCTQNTSDTSPCGTIAENFRWVTQPSWYVQNRTQLHAQQGNQGLTPAMALYPKWGMVNPAEAYWNVSSILGNVGANVITRDVAVDNLTPASAGTAWYTQFPNAMSWLNGLLTPSEQPKPFDATQQFMLQAKQNPNAHVIGYYFFASDMKFLNNGYQNWYAAQPNWEYSGGGNYYSVTNTNPPPAYPVQAQTCSGSYSSNNLVSSPGRSYYLSMNSPYLQQVVIPRMGELMSSTGNYGMSGLYFDATHGASDGDWSCYSQNLYQSIYGEPFPQVSTPATSSLLPPLSDPNYRKILSFYDLTNQINFSNQSAEANAYQNNFTSIEQEIHGGNPNGVSIMSMFSLPSLWNPRTSTEFASLAQVPKMEWDGLFDWRNQVNGWAADEGISLYQATAGKQMSFTLSLIRDAANGRSPHVWIYNPEEFPYWSPKPPTAASVKQALQIYDTNQAQYRSGSILLYATSSILAHGAVANIDVSVNDISTMQADQVPSAQVDPQNPANLFQPSVDLGNKVGSWVGQAKPLHYLAIHYSEAVRDAAFSNNNVDDKMNVSQVWTLAIAPPLFTYSTLTDLGVPVNIITDGQLARQETSDYQILVMTSPKSVLQSRPDLIAAINAFKGVVIWPDDYLFEYNQGNKTNPNQTEFIANIKTSINKNPPPVQIENHGTTPIQYGIFQSTDPAHPAYYALVSGDSSWLSENCRSYTDYSTGPSSGTAVPADLASCYQTEMTQHQSHGSTTIVLNGSGYGDVSTIAYQGGAHVIKDRNATPSGSIVTLPAGDFLSGAKICLQEGTGSTCVLPAAP